MSSTTSRKETERTKLIQEKCQTLLTQMLRDEDNKYCVDCDAKGPRWASWNLGVFLCIRCAGIHRNLGVHISRVKSVNLDTWTPEQVISLQQMGNSRARAVYEAQLPDGFRRPQTDTALESFIRSKYEHKKYLAREWLPPPPPKVDWAKEIDEELEKQKRKKKAAQACAALGLTVSSSVGNGDKKPNASNAKSAPLPAPLPKPKANQQGGSPKIHRTTVSDNNQSNDLLGLSSPTKPIAVTNSLNGGDLHNDSFSNFLSASPSSVASFNNPLNQTQNTNPTQNSLAKEEEDFFNKGSLSMNTVDKDKSGKLTKDSILALYANTPAAQPPMNFVQPQHPPTSMFPGSFTGMAPGGYMQATSAQPPQQFMTPPNSTSMYNTPVMAAPAAFSAAPGMSQINSFASQYSLQPQSTSVPVSSVMSFPTQQMSSGIGMNMGINMGIGLMPTAQGAVPTNNMNLMQTNQNFLSGMNMNSLANPVGANAFNMPLPGMGGVGMGMSNFPTNFQANFQTQQTSTTAAAASLNQQFGNLNIGNVWQ